MEDGIEEGGEEAGKGRSADGEWGWLLELPVKHKGFTGPGG